MLVVYDLVSVMILGGLVTGSIKAAVGHNWWYLFIFTSLYFLLNLIGTRTEE